MHSGNNEEIEHSISTVLVKHREENINFRRQTEIFDPSKFQSDIGIVGLGSIGSNTAIALTRLGLKKLSLHDFDKVEEHNLPSQTYSIADIGEYKATALAKSIKSINKNSLYFTSFHKFDGVMNTDDILIIAVDSMDERKRICSTLKDSLFQPKFIIDGRMGGPQLEIYTCQSADEWKETFVDNPDVDPCGARSICYISMVIGGLIANQVKRIIKGEKYCKEIIFNIDRLQILC